MIMSMSMIMILNLICWIIKKSDKEPAWQKKFISHIKYYGLFGQFVIYGKRKTILFFPGTDLNCELGLLLVRYFPLPYHIESNQVKSSQNNTQYTDTCIIYACM